MNLLTYIKQLPDGTYKKLRKILECNNLGYQDVADNTTYSYSLVSKVCTGAKEPTPRFVKEFCEYLQIDPDIFFQQKEYQKYLHKVQKGVDK